MLRSYSELKKLKTFKERFDYLKLNGKVGQDTFGYDRHFNQMFYSSPEWKSVRNKVIARDEGCDLGIEGHEIDGIMVHGKLIRPKIFVHHMNPVTLNDIENDISILLDPEYLITVTFETHNALHYGNIDPFLDGVSERSPNDTCPWKNSFQVLDVKEAIQERYG